MKDNRLPHNQVPLPSRDFVTAQQVNILLGIISTLGSHLNQPEFDEQNPHKGGRYDGGWKASAHVTLVNACEQLDKLLLAEDRWSISGQQILEVKAEQMMEANIAFLKAQTEASASLTSPAYQHRPNLIRISDGNWVAILGDPKIPESCVIGVGETPAEALKSFDAAWQGILTPSAISWLESQKAQTSKRKTKEKPEKPETDEN